MHYSELVLMKLPNPQLYDYTEIYLQHLGNSSGREMMATREKLLRKGLYWARDMDRQLQVCIVFQFCHTAHCGQLTIR